MTSPYPAGPDGYGPSFRGAVSARSAAPAAPGGREAICPTGAILDGGARVDRGRCILCGRCVAADPSTFAFESSPEVATLQRAGLVVPPAAGDEEALREVRAALARRVRALRRSVHIRHVDAGSDGSEEWEVAALTNPVYDMQRLGIFFTASPRHADILLVTGAGARGLEGAVRRTYEAMPTPTAVIAAGTDAVSGGLVSPSYATSGGIGGWLPVDVWIPGSPPSPFSLLHGILLAMGRVPERAGLRAKATGGAGGRP